MTPEQQARAALRACWDAHEWLRQCIEAEAYAPYPKMNEAQARETWEDERDAYFAAFKADAEFERIIHEHGLDADAIADSL